MKITLKNRLSELLRNRRIRSASEFGRRMVDAGFSMSSSHATRFEKDDPLELTPPGVAGFDAASHAGWVSTDEGNT